MKVLIFTLSFLGLISLIFCDTFDTPVTSTYTATLNAGQVVGTTSNSAATGTAALLYNAKTQVLSWTITHNVNNPLTADLHAGKTGENGPLIIPFSSATSPITGSKKISSSNALKLMNDKTYIDIHTAQNTLGEIRGQVTLATVEGIIKGEAELEGIKNVPPVSTTASGSFTFTFSNLTQLMTYKISHDVKNATAIHIHGPAPPSDNAGVLYTFPTAAKKSSGNFTLTEAHEAHLLNGLLYVTVHSTENPGGEIRGQIDVKSISLSTGNDDDDGLSGGEIFAIIFFVFVGVLLLAGLAYFLFTKRSTATSFQSTAQTPSAYRKSSTGMNASLLDDAQSV